MKVIDDFLPAEALQAMVQAMGAKGFPWLKTPILFPPPFGLEDEYNQQLVHGFVQRKPGFRHDSPHLPLIEPLLRPLDAAELIKVKMNVTRQRGKSVVYGWHVDTRRPGATTAIYYLNTNNGYTAFEDGRRVDSVANRIVLFDASLRHSGASCTDTAERWVMNLNFMPRPGTLGDFSA